LNDAEFATRFFDSATHGRPFTPVLGGADQTNHVGKAQSDVEHCCDGIIRGSIVDDNDFASVAGRQRGGDHALQQSCNELLFVVQRYDDGHLDWRWSCHSRRC